MNIKEIKAQVIETLSNMDEENAREVAQEWLDDNEMLQSLAENFKTYSEVHNGTQTLEEFLVYQMETE
ncbi:hypothetical protein AAXE64_08375 [Priestia megaterium]